MIASYKRSHLFIAAATTLAVLALGRTSLAELVAYWDFNEGSGTVTDSVSGNVGTLQGDAAFSTDVATVTGGGYSVAFDGTTDRITVPDDASVSPTGSITLSAWFKASTFPGTGAAWNILAKSSNSSYRWRLNNNGQLWALLNDGLPTPATGHKVYNSGVLASANDWYHTALIADFAAGEVRFYLDGALVSTQNIAPETGIADNSAALVIGAYNTTGSESFNGLLDEVAIWDQVIPDTSIQALANGTATPLTAATPEPSTLAMLLGLGGIALLGYLRRRRRD